MYDMLRYTQTINLTDGEQCNLYNTVDDFAELLHSRLGYEAEHVFRELLEETRLEAENDFDRDETQAELEAVSVELADREAQIEEAQRAVEDIRRRLDKFLLERYSRIQLVNIVRELEELEKGLKL